VSEHLGYEKGGPAGRGSSNNRGLETTRVAANRSDAGTARGVSAQPSGNSDTKVDVLIGCTRLCGPTARATICRTPPTPVAVTAPR
jgi:hypothetical protein